MKGWRMAAAVAALTAAAGLGAALGPPTKAQTTVRAQSPRAVQIVSGGSRIGVTVRDIEDGDTKGKQTAGVIVEDVATDGPAAKAGIRKGDAIVEFDGERVRSARQLTRLVQETPAGRSVNAVLARDGQRTTVTVTPGDSDGFSFDFDSLDFDSLDEVRDLAQNFRYRIAPRAAVPPARPIPPTPPPPPPGVWKFDGLLGRSSRLGVTLDSLSSQLAEYFGTKRGVLVTSVYDDSAAAKAGLKAGDVITSFNGSAVDGPADVRRMIQDLQEDAEFTIEVMRDRKPVTLKGKMERMERRRSTSRTIL